MKLGKLQSVRLLKEGGAVRQIELKYLDLPSVRTRSRRNAR